MKHSLNFASVILFSVMIESDSWVENNRPIILATVAYMLGITDALEVEENALIEQAIRNYLLNGDNALHNALVIMALFVVYTMAIDQVQIGSELDLTKFPTELGDNMGALVNAYESNLFYADGRLEKSYHTLLNLMDWGNTYQPSENGIITFATQFADNRNHS